VRPSKPAAMPWSLQHLWLLDRAWILFGIGTAFAWAHTIDEARIGQLIALPFAALNTVAFATWTRLPRGWRAGLALAFGLLWIVTVIPYHVMPLMHGIVTWQNVSGLSRVIGGVIMIVAGARLALKSG
jgi:uncharacterized membrane protein